MKENTSMQQQRIEGMRVAIVVTDLFEQVEMTEPRKALDEAGAKTTLVAPHDGQVQGVSHVDKGDRFNVDMTLASARPGDFDAVLLPGGALNADKLRMDTKAQAFVRAFDAADKPIAAICHAPWLLVSAGIAGGRTLTSYYTLQDDLRNAGARWLDIDSCTDRNWTTSRNPDDIPAFNRAMLELFSTYRSQAAKRRAA
jgi:protease I